MEDLNQNLEQEESLFDEVEEVEDESLFDEEDEAVEETESTEDTPTEEETEEPAETEPFMTIRYNKEDKALSRDEAITMAQKGMNYDHLQGKYDTLNNRLTQLAQMTGMNVEQYLEQLNTMQSNYALQQEVKALKEQYPNSDESLLKEIAQKRVNERFEQNKAQIAQTMNNEAEVQQKEIERQVAVFEKRYPNVAADKLDKQVYDMMNEGYTLLEAYQTYLENQRQVKEKEEQQRKEVERINMKNKKKSLGNIGTSENSTNDDFMSGFMG